MISSNGQDDLSEKNLKIGYWIAQHKSGIRKGYLLTAGIFATISVLLFVVTLFDWATHIRQTDEIIYSLTQPAANFNALRERSDLSIRRAIAITRDEKTVDAFVEISNPNVLWAATYVEYEILVGGISSGKTTTTLAPGQALILTTSAKTSVESPPVQMLIHDVTWKKLANTNSLPEENWEFTQTELSQIESSNENSIYQSQLKVTLQNRSVLGFRDVQVVTLLVDKENTVQAVGNIELVSIKSLENRELTFRWPKKLSKNLTPIIQINVDKLTEDRIIRKLSD